MHAELYEIYRNAIHWLIPVVLIAAVRYLAEITKQLTEISKSLAVVVTQIEGHEVRITRIENKVLGQA